MIDLQESSPNHEIELKKVGIEGLKKAIFIKKPKHAYRTIVTVNSYICLPSSKRGAHMSRFIESSDEIPNEAKSIEELAEKISKSVSVRHGHDSETYITSELPFEKVKPNGKKEEGIATMFAKYQTKTGRKSVGVSLSGVLACPCSKELTGGLTHNQRGNLTVEIDATKGDVELLDIIDICNRCFSSPTYSLLKRSEEKMVVQEIHRNPKFVEDVTRDCTAMLKTRYPKRSCTVKCISFESIHDHNISSEWSGVL